jgi:hypothetical protein
VRDLGGVRADGGRAAASVAVGMFTLLVTADYFTASRGPREAGGVERRSAAWRRRWHSSSAVTIVIISIVRVHARLFEA